MPAPLRLLHITDSHLFADADTTLRGVNTRATLAQVMDAATACDPSPDAILATGDLSEDGSEGSYRAFRELAGAPGVPVHCLPGNHDEPDAMRRVLDRAPLSVHPEVEAGDWVLVLLDSRVAGSPGGRLADAELRRLDDALARHHRRHALVCVHHQPVPMGSRWLDRHRIANADALFDRLASHRNVRALLWGHVHQALDTERDGLRLLSTPSTCDQFLPGSDRFATDDRPPAWRRLELHDSGRIDTSVHWLA